MKLPQNVLLHAGPAFGSPEQITLPILNSACVAAVYEGVAKDFDQAEAMILSRELLLKPVQDHDVVTPLAAVVSVSMPLHTIYDAWGGQQRIYAPINGGSRPAIRLGLRSTTVLEHTRWLNTRFLDVLQNGIAEGIALVPPGGYRSYARRRLSRSHPGSRRRIGGRVDRPHTAQNYR